MASPQKPWKAEYAKSSRSSCKTCKSPIAKEVLRLGKMVQATQFDGFMPVYFPPLLFPLVFLSGFGFWPLCSFFLFSFFTIFMFWDFHSCALARIPCLYLLIIFKVLVFGLSYIIDYSFAFGLISMLVFFKIVVLVYFG
jgi:hypothetical protein